MQQPSTQPQPRAKQKLAAGAPAKETAKQELARRNAARAAKRAGNGFIVAPPIPLAEFAKSRYVNGLWNAEGQHACRWFTSIAEADGSKADIWGAFQAWRPSHTPYRHNMREFIDPLCANAQANHDRLLARVEEEELPGRMLSRMKQQRHDAELRWKEAQDEADELRKEVDRRQAAIDNWLAKHPQLKQEAGSK